MRTVKTLIRLCTGHLVGFVMLQFISQKQIPRVIDDNLGIIFHISPNTYVVGTQKKHLYAVIPVGTTTTCLDGKL